MQNWFSIWKLVPVSYCITINRLMKKSHIMVSASAEWEKYNYFKVKTILKKSQSVKVRTRIENKVFLLLSKAWLSFWTLKKLNWLFAFAISRCQVWMPELVNSSSSLASLTSKHLEPFSRATGIFYSLVQFVFAKEFETSFALEAHALWPE